MARDNISRHAESFSGVVDVGNEGMDEKKDDGRT